MVMHHISGSTFSKAISLGFPFTRGEGKALDLPNGVRIWLSRFENGEGKAVFVGFDYTAGKYVVEHGSDSASS